MWSLVRPGAFVFIVSVGLMLTAASHAQAQAAARSGGTSAGRDNAARELFNAGRAAYDEALYDDALTSFKRAYELSKRPALLFNIGQAADRARRDAEALAAFEQYLRDMPKADNRDYVEGRIATLKQAQSQRAAETEATPDVLTVSPPAQSSVASAPPAAMRSDEPQRDEDGGSVLSKWWFWTAIGAGVAAITVTGVVLASQDPELQTGDVGGVVRTLKVAP